MVCQQLKLPLYPHLGLNTLKGGDTATVLKAGLPNITGYIGIHASQNVGGAFTKESTGGTENITGTSGLGTNRAVFDAANSNLIYGNSDTVQPPALSLLPQIRY